MPISSNPLRRASIAALSSLALLAAPCVAEPNPQPVFDLVNERLLQMREVALYKAQNGLPVGDADREVVVLETAEKDAAAVGLDPATVTAFYRLQIQAAKTIQYRHLADWMLDRRATSRPAEDLQTALRPRLIQIGAELTAALAAFFSDQGCFRPSHLPHFLRSVTAEHLTDAEKAMLFESMIQIDLATPFDHCGDDGGNSDLPVG